MDGIRTVPPGHLIRVLNVLAGAEGQGYLRPREQMVQSHGGVNTRALSRRGRRADSGKSKSSVRKKGCRKLNGKKGKDQKGLWNQMKDLDIFLDISSLKHVATRQA